MPRGDPWSDARGRGVDFRAVGQEPGWLLEIDNERGMHLAYDYGEKTATAPLPARTVDGSRTTYAAKTDAHELTVVIDAQPCQDVMSGESFAATVTVRIDGRTPTGCGRTVGR